MIREKLMLKTQDNTIQSSGWQNTQNVHLIHPNKTEILIRNIVLM